MKKGIEVDLEKLKRNIGNKPELAEFMKISRNTLYRKLAGDVELRLIELNQIAQYLGHNTLDFLKEVDLIGFEEKTVNRPGVPRKQENGSSDWVS